jgi:lipopolysaccharide transport system permease protein
MTFELPLAEKPERMPLPAYWELLMNLTRREVKGRYSQSFFGVAWAIAQPLAMMAVFTLVFSRLAQVPSGGVPYPIFAFSALVPWFFFANSVNSGTLSLVTYRNIVTKTYFPREIVPLAQICARLVDFAAAAALYAVLLAFYGMTVGPWALGVPLLFLLLVLFTISVTLLTSALNVFYRDVNPVVQIGLQLWLYVTPVAYPLSLVPDRFRFLFALNPLTGIVEGFRSVLLFGRPPDMWLVGTATIITLLLSGVSLWVFKRLDKYFADVI